jgi:SAM-dependent methyltransferase
MAKIEPFERHTEDYELWFENHPGFYRSELNLLGELLGKVPRRSVEIGVGSGRFAAPLGVPFGIDPSPKMSFLAKKRGIKVVLGVAEKLPLKGETFDLALMVTTICFVDDPLKTFREAARILKRDGKFAVAFVDRESFLGRLYERKKERSKFYKPARFFSTNELLRLGRAAGFETERVLQTIFDLPDRFYETKEGYGGGAFVGILFRKF